jgi:hypothetical protein
MCVSGLLLAVTVLFETSAQEGSGFRVMFFTEQKVADGSVTAFDIYGGTLVTKTAVLYEEEPETFWYQLELDAVSDEGGYDDIALLLPAQPKARAEKLTKKDLAALGALKDKKKFSAVQKVMPIGIDLDGDKRVDLAFVEVCIEYPRGDSICGIQSMFVAKRSSGWKLTEYCSRGCEGL